MKIVKIDMDSEEYPEILKNIKDPPKELFCAGDLSLMNSRCIAVVGSRKTTEYGRWAGTKVAERLAIHGITVVSGLAVGIDGCAHSGALNVEGKTIAVLGCGHNIAYPATNVSLKSKIIEKGLVISEFSPDYPASKYTFPRRNRIISGLSEAIIVAEAGLNSGALITAELANEQGREVFVIPGNINSTYSIGGNMLMRDGVKPLVVVDDILTDLGLERKKDKKIEMLLGSDEKEVFQLLSFGGELSVDEICMKLKKGPAKVNGIVTILEMKGLVYTALGKVFIAK